MQEAKAADRAVFLWTVNDVVWMKWCIGKGVQGVITDDPETYLEVCRNFQDGKVRLPSKAWISVILVSMLARLAGLVLRTWFGFEINIEKETRILEA